MNDGIKGIKESIKPLPHPPHYLLHRYWGRKAHNVVNEFLQYFTKEDETVLDPFMGSGVTVIESLKLKRKAIGVDLNPISCFITQNTLSKIDLSLLVLRYKQVIDSIPQNLLSLYETLCPRCKALSFYENAIWNRNILMRVRGICKKHGIFVKESDDFDLVKIKDAKKILTELSSSNSIWYPQNEILKYVRRNGNTTLDQLFTKRALVALGVLLKEIQKVKEDNVRDLLKLCFSSILPNVSNMIPGDLKRGTGKSGWVISKLYTPPVHAEKNVFKSFRQRFEKIIKGKIETNSLVLSNNALIFNISAERLEGVLDASVDYIFTDPPYGESIPYFGISMLWNCWLGFNVDYGREIICDPYRKRYLEDYERMMFNAFKEMYRVLKPGKFLSFTFHNRKLDVWKAVIESCKKAGFQLADIIYQPQAVGSGTQGLNRRNTLKGDFVYNFIKPQKPISINLNFLENAEEFIIESVNNLIERYNGVTSARLYEELIPLIIHSNAYVDKKGTVIDIEKLLHSNFAYEMVSLIVDGQEKVEHKWIFPGMKKEFLQDRIDNYDPKRQLLLEFTK